MEVVKHVPALPATVQELIARKRMVKPTLNDHVDSIHLKLWPDPDYQALLDAVSNEDAVEGSLAADNVLAAERIRKQAQVDGDDYVANKKLAAIIIALNVVLRRYTISRNERRNSIAGVIVPGGDNVDKPAGLFDGDTVIDPFD